LNTPAIPRNTSIHENLAVRTACTETTMAPAQMTSENGTRYSGKECQDTAISNAVMHAIVMILVNINVQPSSG